MILEMCYVYVGVYHRVSGLYKKGWPRHSICIIHYKMLKNSPKTKIYSYKTIISLLFGCIIYYLQLEYSCNKYCNLIGHLAAGN